MFERAGDRRFFCGAGSGASAAIDAATQHFECLPERRDIGLRIRIALRERHQQADASHALSLLRARRERPRGRRTAERR